jgi:hypothetical protein
MKQAGHYNKLTPFFEEYLAEHRLKEGELRHYQAKWGKPNLDISIEILSIRQEQQKEHETFYNNSQIPTKDIIKCPKTGKNVEIGWIDIGDEGKPVLKYFYPGSGQMGNFRFNGRWTLNGDNPEDVELDEYLLLCSYREGISWRNKSKDVMYEVKDFKAESKNKNAARDNRRKAMNLAAAYREQDNLQGARDIAASLNWRYHKDEESDILYDALEAYAESHSQDFLTLLSSPLTEIKTSIKQAIDNGFLKYDLHKGTMYQGASALASFSSNDHTFDYLTAFAEWIQTSPNGMKVLEGIKKKNKTAAEKQLTPA